MNILFFSFLAAGATIIGGGIPLLRKKLSDKQLSLLVAFSAVVLTAGMNHMVAESVAEAGRWAMLSVSIGFVVLYGYEKMAMVHACREHDCHVHSFGLGVNFPLLNRIFFVEGRYTIGLVDINEHTTGLSSGTLNVLSDIKTKGLQFLVGILFSSGK